MTFRERTQYVLEWLKRVVTQPRSELTRWQRAARYAYDLGIHGARQLRQDKAPQMAAALSYRTLFGLLPVLVVATVVVGSFRGADEWMLQLENLMNALELDKVIVSPTDGVGDGVPLTKVFMERVAQAKSAISFTAVGGVGVAIVIYSAISLMVTIENSFNSVYRAPEGRSWGRRVPVYWTVLTLGPIAIGLTAYLNTQFTGVIEHLPRWGWLLAAAPVVWSFTIAWLLMLLVYKTVPATNVAMRPALIGSFVAALMFQVGAFGISSYFQGAVSLRQLWGSLAFIPLFMFWIYVMWMVVLFGLEVASTIQLLGGRRIGEIEGPARHPTGLVDPASVFVIMEIIAERFGKGRPCSPREVADASDIPELTVTKMFDALVEAGLLHRLEHEESKVTLALPPEQVSGKRLIEIGYALVDRGRGSRRSELADRLRAAQRTLAAQATLQSAPAPP